MKLRDEFTRFVFEATSDELCHVDRDNGRACYFIFNRNDSFCMNIQNDKEHRFFYKFFL